MENSEHESGELSDGELMSDIVQLPPPPPLSPIKEQQQSTVAAAIVVDELNEITTIFKEFQQNKLTDHTTVLKFYQQRKNNDIFYKSIHSFIKSNRSIHSITVILSFIITIFEILYKHDNKLSFEYFTEIIYKISITESPDNLASVIFFSKFFNSSGNSNNDVFNMVFSFLEWESKKTIINNGIKFLGSILSLSISLGQYNILQITFNWLINFKRIDKSSSAGAASNISLEISDISDNINNIDNQFITIKILDILINDHLILNESSNNFENLPKYSFDFAQLLTSIILSNYLNNGGTGSAGGDNNENNNEINPKLLSLLSNYWILEKPQLLLSNCFKTSTINNVNILQEIIKLCIFSNYELVEPYIIKLNSILMNTIFQISESVSIGSSDSNGGNGSGDEFSTKLIKYLTSTLNPSFFESIITNINNKKSTTTIDKLSQIIQICSLVYYKKQEYIQSHIQLLSKLTKHTKLSNTILNQNK